MGAELRVYRRRIRSVKSTQKITRAMELIAASRIARAQSRLRGARPYTVQITRAAQNVALQSGVDHPMLRPPAEDSGVALLVVTSDRGLAGAYSSSVLRLAEQLAEQAGVGGRPVRLYVTGRKGVGYFRFRERPVEESWAGFSEQPTYEHAKDIAATLLKDFLSGRVGEVQVAFTDFFSVLTQRPVTSRLLPLGPDGVTTVPAPGSTPPGYATGADGDRPAADGRGAAAADTGSGSGATARQAAAAPGSTPGSGHDGEAGRVVDHGNQVLHLKIISCASGSPSWAAAHLATNTSAQIRHRLPDVFQDFLLRRL